MEAVEFFLPRSVPRFLVVLFCMRKLWKILVVLEEFPSKTLFVSVCNKSYMAIIVQFLYFPSFSFYFSDFFRLFFPGYANVFIRNP